MAAHRAAAARMVARGIGAPNRANVDHIVEYCASGAGSMETAGERLAGMLGAGAAVVIIAPRANRQKLRRALASRRRNVDAARKRGQYVELDAAILLKKFM